MNQDTASKFFRPVMSEDDVREGMNVSPYFLAYLQSKIEAYATALVDTPLVYDPDPSKQVVTLINYERARTMVQAYEELLAELIDARQQNMAPPTER